MMPLLQLLPELGVFTDQLLPLELEEPVYPHSLGDHRRHHPEELQEPVELTLWPVHQLDRECSNHHLVQEQRHTKEAELTSTALQASGCSVQEAGILADPGHDDGLPGAGDRAGDAFTDQVTTSLAGGAEPDARPDFELTAGVVQQGDGAPDSATAERE